MPFKDELQMHNYWLYSTRGITPHKKQALIDLAGDISTLFKDADIIRNSRVRLTADEKERLISRMNTDMLASEIFELNKMGIRIVTRTDAAYPELLSEIHTPPELLYYKGDITRLSDMRLAVVGTRKPTYKGAANTFKLCRELSENGISIISGMARGIDTSAAKGALKGGTPTAAVLGCGIDIPYPKENEILYDEIAESGVVISEYPPGVPPIAENFPPRNRIISGMSQALLICEGLLRSGGAISVRNAIEQNREVFALPGDISQPLSELPNTLISEGANIVLSAKTILDYYKSTPYFPRAAEKCNIELDFYEKQIYTLLKQGELTSEQICEMLDMDISSVMLSLTMLEIKQAIVRLPGNLFTAKY